MRRLLWPLGLAAALSSPFGVLAQPDAVPAAPAAAAPPLTLATAFTLAQAYSPAVSAARRELEATEGERQQAGVIPNPEIAFTREDTQRRESRTDSWQLNIPIELGGKRGARVAQAERGIEVARAQLAAAEAELGARLVAAFFRVVVAQERSALAQSSAQLAARAADVTGRRVQAGKISPVDETRARVEQANAGLERDEAHAELRAAREALAAFWGSPELAYAKVDGDLDALPQRPATAQLLDTIDASPVLTASRLGWEQRKAGIAVERSKQYPDITLNLGVKRPSELNGETGAITTRSQNVVGITVPLPLFDRNQGNVRAAISRADKAEDEYKAARIQLVNEVQQAASQLALARASAQTLKTTILPAAQQAHDAATRGFEAGKFAFLDVLDAQRSLLQARVRYVGVVTSAYQAATTLDRLLGRPSSANDSKP